MVFLVSFMIYLLGIFPSLLFALPSDPTVQAGSVTINETSADHLTILQGTDKAIIDWRSFGILGNERVDFQLPSSNGVTLNRVTGNEPSAIFGKLTSNGNLFLINPNGILFGAGSQIDVHGLVATTSDIRNEDFLIGNYNFNIPSNRAALWPTGEPSRRPRVGWWHWSHRECKTTASFRHDWDGSVWRPATPSLWIFMAIN